MRGWQRPVRGRTYPSHRPHSQIDHVLVRGGIEVARGRGAGRDAVGSPARSEPGSGCSTGNVIAMSAQPASCAAPTAGDGAQSSGARITRYGSGLRRIIRYHELLVGMVRKELKIKYKNSVLGLRVVAAQPAAVPRRLLHRVREDPAARASRRSRSGCSRVCSCGTSSRPGSARATGSVVAQLRAREEGVVPARDPSARRGRQHARALLPAEPGAVRRARHRAMARRVGVRAAVARSR